MEYVVICLAAFFISLLSFFSGFGLGTVLMPVFAVFFPVYVAVILTAIVHFFNNIFKLVLLGRYADKIAVIRFGIPAVFAAFLGARALLWLSGFKPLIQYQFLSHIFQITPVKLVVAVLMIFFSLFEIAPKFEKISFEKRYLPLGGILSGFFGGLSGHQGALRSAFLLKCGLMKESFIATGVVIACLVDSSRILAYSADFASVLRGDRLSLVAAAIISAFSGAFIGSRLLKKVTMRMVQFIVAIFLFVIAVGLGAGVI